ncbi:MAG: vitamin B12 transporter [Halioglobus sp.]|jgi:vitamin B12 transporter
MIMNKFIPISLLAVASISSHTAIAIENLEEIVITSSRIPMAMRKIGTSVSVITSDEIQQRGFNSLVDILRSQPGIAVSNSGGPGKATALRIRGEEGFRTLMLLDGIDISDASSTQVGPRIENILSAGIERVEVLRGPQGLLYGADAGGVINITTDSVKDGLGGQVSAEGGRYGTSQIAANLGGSNGTVDFAVSAVDFQTDGFNARTTDLAPSDDDGYDNTTFHGRVGWNVTEDLRLQLVAHDIDGENEYDNCFGIVDNDDCNDDFDQSSWRAVADYTLGSFTHQLAYSGNDTERTFYTEGQISFATEGEVERLSYLGSFSPSDALRLIYGVDLETETIDDGSVNRERDQDGYFAEYQGSFGDALFLTAGVRYDDNEDFGTHTSYRLSGAYVFEFSGGDLKLKSTYGTGFRAPSLSEIAYNAGSFAYPPASNVSLEEETSEGFDLGLSWYSDAGLYLEAVYFDQTVTDEIFFDLDTFSGYLQGSGDSDSTGVELIGEFQLFDSVVLTGNYTYNDTEKTDGMQRVRRPEHLANLGFTWQGMGDRLQFGMNVRGSYDSMADDSTSLDDYEVVDINASFEIVKGLALYGRVENLLDEEYEEILTYNTSGTAGYVGVRYSF